MCLLIYLKHTVLCDRNALSNFELTMSTVGMHVYVPSATTIIGNPAAIFGLPNPPTPEACCIASSTGN